MNIKTIVQYCFTFIFILLTLNNKISSQSLSLASNDKNFYKNSSENIKSQETIKHFHTKIFGGIQTLSVSAPYFVSLRIIEKDKIKYGEGHYCGGTLIKQETILTAASCLFYQYPDGGSQKIDPNEIITVMGTHSRTIREKTSQSIKVNKTIPHKDFHFRTMRHDIGLIIVEKKFATTEFVKVMDMETIVNHKNNDLVKIVGFGKTINTANNSEVLRSRNIPIVNQDVCRRKYAYVQIITKTVLCAGDNKAYPCEGDRGGTLLKENKLYGIISYGLNCDDDYPGLYTIVPYYQDWIARGSGTKNYLNLALCLIFFYTSFLN